MLFASSLQRYLELDSLSEGKRKVWRKINTYTYDRGENARSTTVLLRFLQKLKISRILFDLFGTLT